VRRKADSGTPWGDAYPYLRDLLPKLTPGQCLALLRLWKLQSFLADKVGYTLKAYDPLGERELTWTCIAVYGQSGSSRDESAFPKSLAEVFAAEAEAPAASAA
jgi:hypothetical protein